MFASNYVKTPRKQSTENLIDEPILKFRLHTWCTRDTDKKLKRFKIDFLNKQLQFVTHNFPYLILMCVVEFSFIYNVAKF